MNSGSFKVQRADDPNHYVPFKSLSINQRFLFKREVPPNISGEGLPEGPWKKISHNEYEQESTENVIKIGNVNLPVLTLPDDHGEEE